MCVQPACFCGGRGGKLRFPGCSLSSFCKVSVCRLVSTGRAKKRVSGLLRSARPWRLHGSGLRRRRRVVAAVRAPGAESPLPEPAWKIRNCRGPVLPGLQRSLQQRHVGCQGQPGLRQRPGWQHHLGFQYNTGTDGHVTMLSLQRKMQAHRIPARTL